MSGMKKKICLYHFLISLIKKKSWGVQDSMNSLKFLQIQGLIVKDFLRCFEIFNINLNF